MSDLNAVVAVYGSHVEAEEAVKKLQRGGIDMQMLSIVGKDTHTEERAVGYYNTSDRMKYWARQALSGAACGACCSDPRSFSFPGLVLCW